MKAMAKRYATWAAAALAAAVATLAGAAPAVADTPGFAVKITQSPDTFTVGKGTNTLSAAVTTDHQRRCSKVRWALFVTTNGVSLDQIKLYRVENGQPVAIKAALQGEGARVVDSQLDPGQLCKNQPVTAKWTIGFTGPDNGSVHFVVQALNQLNRPLGDASADAQVVTPVADKQSKPPSASASVSASPSPTSTFVPDDNAAAAKVVTRPSSPAAAALANSSSGSSVLLPGLAVGAVLVFAGVALLMRLRSRNRRAVPGGPGWRQDTQMLPTGFYNMPRRRD
jgi:hypothetical protein